MFNECAIYWSVIASTLLLYIMVDLVVVIDAGCRLLFVTMLKSKILLFMQNLENTSLKIQFVFL